MLNIRRQWWSYVINRSQINIPTYVDQIRDDARQDERIWKVVDIILEQMWPQEMSTQTA